MVFGTNSRIHLLSQISTLDAQENGLDIAPETSPLETTPSERDFGRLGRRPQTATRAWLCFGWSCHQ
jgi:hypothetical protein